MTPRVRDKTSESYARELAGCRAYKHAHRRVCASCGEKTVNPSTQGDLCVACHARAVEPPHGTDARYTSKKWRCRCQECRAAHATYMRGYLARRRARVVGATF